ncbi:DUF11 domain-containing protein [Microtetraspora sp. AC03309]|uniref:PKD domain-containing protein n=1 Tax=Microtetraspora sp. AC03309 TaxID=2779376 RepID=UPI001E3F491A|nr:PKD domain-containing protein [Microtetraspora sp. AC03309]MCC5575166.1 DUF11 domain-containing protein [Microtetraspora sp. AC03309]
MDLLFDRGSVRRIASPLIAGLVGLTAMLTGSLAVPLPALAASGSASSPDLKAMAAAPETKIIDLGSVVDTRGVDVGDINNGGEVIWAIGDPKWEGYFGRPQARLTSGGIVTDLHALLGLDPKINSSVPRGISADGTVLVTSGKESFLVKKGNVTPARQEAFAINDRGQYAGMGYLQNPDGSTLNLWGSKNKFYMEPTALNNSGSVVGRMDVGPGSGVTFRAFRSRPHQPIDPSRDELVVPGADWTQANDINGEGVVAGHVDGHPQDGSGDIPVIWDKEGTHHIQRTPYGGRVDAINEFGIGVGVMYTDAGKKMYNAHAALFQGGVGNDLNLVLPQDSGWTLREATGINDNGQIVGLGRPEGADADHAFLLDLGFVKPEIESFELETRLFPSKNWVPVPEKGTVEGNQVRVTVSLFNPNVMPVRRTLEVVEDGTGKVVRNGRFELLLDAGETVRKQVAFDTEGLAWRNGQPYSDRSVTVRVLNDGRDESQDTKPIVIRPMPVVLVHGWNSNAATWDKYGAFLKSAHPLWKWRKVSTLNTGSLSAPGQLTHPLPLNAAMLGLEIEDVRTSEDAWRVQLVVHSMGGTISREYIAWEMGWTPEEKPVVNRLIQMGTPNEGSPCADRIVEWAEARNRRTPWYPATWENSEEYMQGEFNKKTTNLKGVRVSNLVGRGYELLCGTKVGGDVVPEPLPLPHPDTDMIVPPSSARWMLADTPSMHIMHTKMTGSQAAFDDYVKPRLVSLLAGGSGDGPGLREAAPASGEKEAAPASGNEKAAADADDAGGASSLFAFPEATVEPGTTAAVPLEVPSGTRFGVVGTLPETVGLLLRDPSGKEAASYAAGSDEAKEVVQGLSVTAPQAGAWKLEITNTAAEPVKADLGAWILDNPVRVAATAEASEDGKVAVKATVTDGGQPVAGVPVRAVLTLGDGTQQEVTLKDDGNSGDGAADDGKYGGVTEALADGVYPVTVVAETAKGVRTTLNSAKVAKPDLREFALTLSAGPGGSVSASPAQTTYRAGTEVKVTATPEAGGIPIGWVVDGKERGPGALTLTMDGPHTVEARFGTYKVTEIGALPGGEASKTYAETLNDRGEVAATVVDKDGKRRAVRWQDGEFTELGGLACTDGAVTCEAGAMGVNEAGDVAGWAVASASGGNSRRAVVWRADGSVTEPQSGTSASALNDYGHVLGSTGNGAVLWGQGAPTMVPSEYVSSPAGYDNEMNYTHPAPRINGSGAITGGYTISRNTDGSPRDSAPALYADDRLTRLAGTVEGCAVTAGYASDLNNTGLVVGTLRCGRDEGKVTKRAYVWKNGRPTDLGAGEATAVNDNEVIVGHESGAYLNAYQPPVMWMAGTKYQLEKVLSSRPWCPEDGRKTTRPCVGASEMQDVNSSGQILVQGFVREPAPAEEGGFTQENRAFLLTPTTARADLEVTHTISPTEPGPGAKVTWTATVTNKGDDAATDVRLDVLIPKTVTGATCETWRGICTAIKGGFRNTAKVLEPGWSATVEVTVTVPADAEVGTELKTQAHGYSLSVRDPVPANDVASTTAKVSSFLSSSGITWSDPVPVGTTSYPQQVSLTNRSNEPMPLKAIATEGPFAQTNDCPVELEVGAWCMVQVTFSPTQAGEANGKLTFTTANEAAPVFTVTLKGTGTTNTSPVIKTPPALPLKGTVGKPFELKVAFTDPDAGDNHTAQVVVNVPPSPAELTPAEVTREPGGGTITWSRMYTAPVQGSLLVLLKDGTNPPVGQMIPFVIEEAVPNTAPQVSAGPDVTVTVGETLQRTVTFTDPGSTSWTASVDYGDGTGPQPVTVTGQQIVLEHQWATAGTYPVTVKVKDDGDLESTASFTATVVPAETPNQAPKVTLTGPATVTEGSTWTGRGSFTDPDSTSWTFTADYGDGTGPQPLTLTAGQLKLTHVFSGSGEFTVVLSVTDDKGATGTAGVKVQVTNVAPVVTLKEPAVVAKVGEPVMLNASFTDPGTADSHTATWTIGTRTVAGALGENKGKGAVSLPYVFTEPGIYPIAVTVTDNDRGTAKADTTGGRKVFVRVYDRSGALTAAGTVTSPAGSCLLETACEDKAGEGSFSVAVRYSGKKGGPKGELRYAAPGFELTGASYETLVAVDGTATLRGTGKVGKAGDAGKAGNSKVTFELTAVDAATTGGADQLRMRVWDATGRLIYDNQPTGAASPAVIGTLRVSG